MTKTEMDIRSVLGPAGGSIRPLAAASDLFARRMFEERRSEWIPRTFS